MTRHRHVLKFVQPSATKAPAAIATTAEAVEEADKLVALLQDVERKAAGYAEQGLDEVAVFMIGTLLDAIAPDMRRIQACSQPPALQGQIKKVVRIEKRLQRQLLKLTDSLTK